MKRFLALLFSAALLLSLLPAFPALTEPLPLAESGLSGVVTVPYDESDPTAGAYVYQYSFPYVNPDHPDAYRVNNFYEARLRDMENDYIPNLSEYYADLGVPFSSVVSFEVTCNNDEYFSVLIRTETDEDGEITRTCEGNTFSRLNGMPGSVFSLPNILGKLDAGETDDFREDFFTERIARVVRKLVWEQIRKDPDALSFDPPLTEEDLSLIFFPDLDFYLDASGDPVFYILAERHEEGEPDWYTFPISLETIRDGL